MAIKCLDKQSCSICHANFYMYILDPGIAKKLGLLLSVLRTSKQWLFSPFFQYFLLRATWDIEESSLFQYISEFSVFFAWKNDVNVNGG